MSLGRCLIFFSSTTEMGDTINSRKYGKPALLSQSVCEPQMCEANYLRTHSETVISSFFYVGV